MRLTASAPGKLVLLGEYAVLEGAPALVMAASRRALVEMRSSAGPGSAIIARGAAAGSASYRFDGGATATRTGSALSLVDAILNDLNADLDLQRMPAFAAELDTSAFVLRTSGGATHKLGLGSSAALTVAFASALAEYTGRSSGQGIRWLGRLISMHRRFQGGRGSGLDVAASLLGGVISYRVNGAGEDPAVVPRPLPDSLRLLTVWSGRPASTEAALERLNRWRAHEPRAHDHALGTLTELALAADAAARDGDAKALLGAFGAYGPALRRFGSASGIEIYGVEHSRIEALARDHGAVYKPCGAGGGDVGVACSADAGALAALHGALERAGFRALDLAVDPVGLQVQPRLE